MLVGCVWFARGPATSAELAAQATQNKTALPSAPKPKLAKDEFVERLKDEFHEDAPAEVEEVWLNTIIRRDLILNNLAHLPKLRRIEFYEIAFSKADIERIALFPQVKQIAFSNYRGLDLAVVSPLKSLEGIAVYRCKDVRWQERWPKAILIHGFAPVLRCS